MARYLQTFGFQVLTRTDDFYITSARSRRSKSWVEQRKAALSAVHMALFIFGACGYFISVDKCLVKPMARIISPDVRCDTDACHFGSAGRAVCQDGSNFISSSRHGLHHFHYYIKNMVGKYASMLAVVPGASLGENVSPHYQFCLYSWPRVIGRRRRGPQRCSALRKC